MPATNGIAGRRGISLFRKYYPSVDNEPIVRDVARQRYWVDEDFLMVNVRDRQGKDQTCNIAAAIIDIIGAYVSTKKEAFESFIDTCRQIASPEHPSVQQAFPELWEWEASEEEFHGAAEAAREPGEPSSCEFCRLTVRSFFRRGWDC
ncbi:MAG: hypothetical protein ACREFK_18195, partial [Stellaceae bacterium]